MTEALREAAQAALEALDVGIYVADFRRKAVIEALRAALAQPQGEAVPVAYKVAVSKHWHDYTDERDNLIRAAKSEGIAITYAYAHPPASPAWVGLTDAELSEIYNRTDWNVNADWNYERAIEAALKAKNAPAAQGEQG